MSSARPLPDLALPPFETALQPIVNLGTEREFAFEALTRVYGCNDVGRLFDRAAECHRAEVLNLVTIHHALAAAPVFPEHAKMFVNVDPIVLASADLPRVIRDGAARSGFPLDHLVVEITERSGFPDGSATTRVMDDLRACGVSFALDDFGSAHSHLTFIEIIQPSYIKVGREFGTDFEQSEKRTNIVRSIAALARALGCSTILEGIESSATTSAARALGIEYGQGYHFGRPVVPDRDAVGTAAPPTYLRSVRPALLKTQGE